MTTTIRAVVFDLGGVVLGSPLSFLANFERRHGLSPALIARLVGGYASAEGPWQRLERGEIELEEFCVLFDEVIRSAGYAASSLEMMRELGRHALIRDEMIQAIRRLRAAGLKVAALTNNWATGDPHDQRMDVLRREFDVFIESWRVGMRKPEPRIYEHAEGVVAEVPGNIVFLDDIGGNLKVARARGWRTIKVTDPRAALTELGTLVNLGLAE